MKTATYRSATFLQVTALAFLAITLVFTSCKKDEEQPETQANRAPGEFTVTTAPDLNSVLISWTTATDPDGDVVSYMVVLSEDTLITEHSQTFYEVLDLEYDTDYAGSVVASDPDGLTRSASFMFTTGIYPNNAPLNFDLTAPADGSTDINAPINFNWANAVDPDGDAITYEILLDQSTQPSTSIVADLTAGPYTYDGSVLEEGQTYYWQVIARDGNGGEVSSTVFGFTMTTTMTLATDEPGWEDRATHTSVVFQDKMWVMGGNTCCGGRYGDVWSSTDGMTWTEEVSDTPWAARGSHVSVVFDDKIWVIGGNSSYTQSGLFGDVWSSENGVDWILVTDAPAFAPRHGHQLLSYDGYMWMFGGSDYDGISQTQIWRTQNGVEWELVTDAASTYFSVTQMVVFDNKMWRIAAYNDDRIFSSTDGLTWNLEQEEPPFGERNGHSCVVHGGAMYLLSGSDNAVNELAELPDLWTSPDGVNWALVSSDAGFESVAAAEALSHDGKLWLLGGGGGWQSNFVTNDVWYLE